MNDLLEQQKQAIAARHGRKKRFQRVLSVLAAATVFVTTYALILPAITLERDMLAAQAAAEPSAAQQPEPAAGAVPGEPAAFEAQPESEPALPEQPDPSLPESAPGGEAFPGVLNPTEPEVSESVNPETEPDEAEPSEQSPEPELPETGTTEPETSGPDTAPSAPEPGASETIPPASDSLNPGNPAPSEPLQTEPAVPQETLPGVTSQPETPTGDPTADVESRAQWENTVAHITRTGDWARDVLAIADTQLGYTESTRNFIWETGRQKGYTRYGAWYGSSYADWCAMFISFCLHYAKIDRALMPIEANCPKWIDKLTELKRWHGPDYVPEPGDLIFFDWERDGVSDHVGLVYDIIRDSNGKPAKVKTIEGNSADRVQYVQYALNDAGIAGYGELPENPNPPADQAQPEQREEPQKNPESKAPQVLTATAENGVKVTLTAEPGSLPHPADELTLSAVVVEDREARTLVEQEASKADSREVRRKSVLFDIKLLHNGEEVEPTGPVSVSFAGIETPKDDAQVYHVDEEAGKAEEVTASEQPDGTITAETDHFSIYGVTFTVDFHYGDYTCSILGKSEILLSELFANLNMDRSAADVTKAVFSDPTLVSVEQVTNDWKLISLKAFNTEESLTITFADGTELVIGVTDAPAGGVGENYVPNTAEVTALNISKVTGTAPWDGDNDPGNDKDATNDIVRSFDTVFYNVGYTLNLTDKYNGLFSGYKKAKLYVKVTLPLTKEQAGFDLDAMPWLTDAQVADNGSSQTLTGHYSMEASSFDYVVPSTGTVRFAVSVKAMANGDAVQPTFELWLDDGDNTNHASAPAEVVTPSATTVSAKAAYDVDIEEIGIKDPGTFGPDPYIVSYAVTLNASVPKAEKGMRGMLVDVDEVSFDIYAGYYAKCKPGVYQGNTSSVTLEAYTPRLYDYSLILSNNATTGQLGKDMTVMSGNGDADMGRRVLPYSSRAESGSADNAAMNSGAMTVTQGVGTPDQRIRVTFSGIHNDYVYPKAAARPDHLGNTASLGTGSAILACGVIQVEYPRENIPGANSYYAGSTVYRHRYLTAYDDLAIHTSSGNSSVKDADPDNDTCEQKGSVLITAQGSGTHMQTYDINGDRLGTHHSSTSQHEYMHPGDKFYASVYAGSGYPGAATYGMDGLLYFDTSIYEPLAEDGDDCFAFLCHNYSDAKKAIQSQSSVVPGVSVKLYYLSIPNEYIDFFSLHTYPRYESLSTMKAAGVTCNAVFVEARSSTPYYNYYTPKVIVPFKIRDDAPATPATAVANNTTRWNCITHQAIMYGQDVSGYTLKNYTSRNSWGPGNGHTYLRVQPPHGGGYTHQIYYLSPGRDVYGRFVGSGSHNIKLEPSGTWYQDAAYFGGFTAIIRDKEVSVGKETSQQESGQPRHVYFAGSGERYADYTLSPELTFAGSSVPPDPKYSTVTVTDTLPKGLSYRDGSAYIGGAYEQPADRRSHGMVSGGTALAPGVTATGISTSATTTGDVTFTVTPKADGTTELKWIITNVQCGQEMPKLYYGACIGDESNPANDVADGQQLTNTANISSVSSQSGNQDSEPSSASWTISIFKLGSGTLIKRISTPETDLDEDIIYTIDYINDSENTLATMDILDLLPYNGDLRGSVIHGSYTVDTVTVERLDDAAGSYALNYTTDTSVQGHEDDLFSLSPGYTAATATVAGKVTTLKLPANTSPTLLNIKGTNVGGYAKIRITVTLHPTGNKDGDAYGNDAAYNTPTIPAPVYAAPVYATVVQQRATLIVKKTLIGGGNISFPFEVLFTDTNGDPVQIPDDTANPKRYAVGAVSPYKVTFSLTGGSNVTLSGIPVGTTATITETNHDGYTVLIKDTTAGGTTLSNTDTATIGITKDQAVEVINNPGVVLPSAGGPGVWLYSLSGLFLISLVILIYCSRRRRHERRCG